MNSISFNVLRPGDTYMCHWTGSSLVHVMACRLVGAKPLPEAMMTYCQLEHWENRFSEVVIRIKIFLVEKLRLEMSSAKVAAILFRPQCVNFFSGSNLQYVTTSPGNSLPPYKRQPITWTITVTSWWARWRLKSPASRLFTLPFVRV